MIRNAKKIPGKAPLIISALCAASPLANAVELEEIIVTAQKRVQSLQDVPIAVAAIDGNTLKDNKINNLEDIATLVPNLSFSGSPGTNTVRIRGLGTGAANGAFEQSVGMYVDGIYAGRGYQFSLPYMDIERVEVLKGPQGVLFGKNSIAGAVSITSAKPTSKFEGEVGLAYETEHQGYSVDAVVSGPITPSLSGRLAAKFREDGGWIDNTLLNDDELPVVETSGYRASLSWEATDAVTVYLKYDHSENSKTGSEFGISHIVPGSTNNNRAGSPTWVSLYEAVDPAVGLITDHKQSKGQSLTSHPNGDFKEVESDAVTLEVKWELGEHTLTLLSGYSEYDMSTFADSSYTPVTTVNQRSREGFEQFTQEIRLTSPVGETLEYIIGAYYMDRSLEYPATAIDSSLSGILGATITVPNAGPGPAFITLPTALLNNTTEKYYQEDTDSLAVFGQVTWNITPDLRTSLGLRYSEETKEARASMDLFELGTATALNPTGALIVNNFYGVSPHSYQRDRDEENLDPSLNVQWDINEELMLYAAVTRATKAGGFNASDRTGSADIIEYEEEQATGLEIGAKAQLMSNRLRFNTALFQTRFDDLQVSNFDANTSAIFVANAAEATTQGIELDAVFALSDTITLGGALAYLDSSFDDFPGAPCAPSVYRQADCVGQGRNAKGEDLIHSPDWTGNVYINYQQSLFDDLQLRLRLETVYSDDFAYNLNYAEPLRQDSYLKWNARVSLSSADKSWEIALIGKNLTNEKTASFGGAVPLSPGVFFSNIDAPRQIFLDARYRF